MRQGRRVATGRAIPRNGADRPQSVADETWARYSGLSASTTATTTIWRSRTRGARTVPRSGSRPCGSVGDARPRKEFIEVEQHTPAKQANAVFQRQASSLQPSSEETRQASSLPVIGALSSMMEADPSADERRAAIGGRRDLPRYLATRIIVGIGVAGEAGEAVQGHVEHRRTCNRGRAPYLTPLEVVGAGRPYCCSITRRLPLGPAHVALLRSTEPHEDPYLSYRRRRGAISHVRR